MRAGSLRGMQVDILRHGDNFIYLLVDDSHAVAVDPGAAGPVVGALTATGLELGTILVTHHHGDHTAGCAELRRRFGCRVVGPRGPGVDRAVQGGAKVPLGGVHLDVLAVPGHTAMDVAYHLPSHNAVFTGDTLFAGGCGRVFGAKADTLWDSLCRLRALPDATRVFGGHDYTLDNLEFAVHVEPDNADTRARLAAFREGLARGADFPVSTIAEEKATNPFFRFDVATFQAAAGMTGASGAAVFAEVRGRKDRW